MLKLYYQNPNGICTFLNDVRHNIPKADYDVMLFTETKLHSDITDNRFVDERYTVYRRDRTTSKYYSKKKGGGVMIVVKNSIKSIRLTEMESGCDDLWIAVDIEDENKTKKRIVICVVYTLCLTVAKKRAQLWDFIHKATEVVKEFDNVIIVGDFNLSNCIWEKRYFGNDYISYPIDEYAGMVDEFNDFIFKANLRQYNNILNINKVVLDLVLINAQCFVSPARTLIKEKFDEKHPPFEITLKL